MRASKKLKSKARHETCFYYRICDGNFEMLTAQRFLEFSLLTNDFLRSLFSFGCLNSFFFDIDSPGSFVICNVFVASFPFNNQFFVLLLLRSSFYAPESFLFFLSPGLSTLPFDSSGAIPFLLVLPELTCFFNFFSRIS